MGAKHSGSRLTIFTFQGHVIDVNDHVNIRIAIRDFLLVVHWNRASVSSRFRTHYSEHTHQKHDESQTWILAEVITEQNVENQKLIKVDSLAYK